MANFTHLPTISPPRLFSLYAGDLHHHVTEHDLYTLFSLIGPVHNIHLFRHPFSHKSLCYAFIHFYFPHYAAVALNSLNHIELRGKPIRLMWVQRDPVLRKVGIGNLFVKNLDSSVNDAELQEVFEVFGVISSCKIARDGDGVSKGFGFIQFCSEDSASCALSALNGSVLHGKILTVAKFLKKSERKEPQFTNVYVKNLDKDFTESSLREKFSEYGKITSAVIMNDAEGKSRGFGFVNFESQESAMKAINGLNGAEIGTKKWFVGKAMTKSQRAEFLRRSHVKQKPNVSNLIVRNLASFVTENDLKQVFGAFGNVTFVKVSYRNSVSSGMACICFSKPEEARKAIAFLNGCFYNGRYMSVSLAWHKEEQAKHLQTLLALRYKPPFAYKVPKLQKLEEKKVRKEVLANKESSCDCDVDGFVLVDKPAGNSEWDV
ncbi:putative RNA recognition motif domain, nucleotide-binding alpha-beta plait domain superfamily [Helianthus annuus]|nr:putative RNA recognition motif domain, nucleotide-binding alpha-beta plait domain superfamily [Helianthus annuus]